MRFIALFRPDELAQPTQQQIEQMHEFIKEAVGAGVLLATEGFGPSTQADVKIRRRKGKFSVTDGPFTESKEWIAGFAILDAPDLDTAIELAAKNPMAYEGRIELRPIHSMGGPDD